MHVEGLLAPDSAEAAREEYDALVPASRTVVREVAKAMSFDREEYDERVTSDVVATAQHATRCSRRFWKSTSVPARSSRRSASATTTR